MLGKSTYLRYSCIIITLDIEKKKFDGYRLDFQVILMFRIGPNSTRYDVLKQNNLPVTGLQGKISVRQATVRELSSTCTSDSIEKLFIMKLKY